MRTIRILALTPTFRPLVGGVETALHELFLRLARRGHEVDVVTPKHSGPEVEVVEPGYRVFRVGSTMSSRPAKLLGYQWWQWRAIRKLHRERPYDLAHLTFAVHGSFLQQWIQRYLRLPVVIDEHHLGTGADIASAAQNPSIVKPLMKMSYRTADAVVAQSRDTGQFIEAASGRRDWRLIPLGSDPDLFHPKKRDEKVREQHGDPRHLLVTASRLAPRKNLLAMLEAMRMIAAAHPESRLVVAGNGPDRAKLEAAAERLGVSQVVDFAGYLPEDELARLLASSDVFLSTATYEGFGLSIVDAMASGLPIVAYDAGGPRDFLHDGDAGFVTAHEPRLLADGVDRLLSSSELRSKMGRRGRAIVEGTYNWDANADAHEELFKRVVGSRVDRA